MDKPLSGLCYRWAVNGSLVGEGALYEGVVTLAPGLYNLTLSALTSCDLEGPVIAQAVQPVAVKYVRRELRALTARDRVAFFQALSIVQRVPTHVGRTLYGDKYRSKDYFNRIHLYYGGNKDCDHWHAFVSLSLVMHYFH